MKRKILKGVFIGNIVLLLSTILNFFINKYFIMYIGIEDMGVLRLFNQLLGMLCLSEMGMGYVASYSLYKPLVENDTVRIKEVFYTMKYFYKKTIFVICILGFLTTFLLPFFIKEEINYIYIICWLFSVLNTAFTYIVAVNISLYNAEKKYNFVKSVSGLSLILCQILKLSSIFLYQSFLIFILLNFISTIINIVVFKSYFNKNYSYLKDDKKYNIDYTLFKDVKNTFVHNFAYFLGYQTDVILISIFCGLKTLGIYSSYVLICTTWHRILQNVFSVLYSHIGHYIVNNTKDDVYKKYKSMNIVLLYFVVLIFITTYYLIQPFMKIWINYTIEKNLFVFLLCLRFSLDAFRFGIETFKLNAGFFSDIHLPMIEGILNLVISLILVSIYGVVGVIIGTIVSSVLIAFIWKPILVYRVVFDKNHKVYVKDFIKYILYSLFIALLSYFVFRYISIEINTFIDFIFEGFKVFGIVTVIATFVFVLDTNFRKVIKNILKIV